MTEKGDSRDTILDDGFLRLGVALRQVPFWICNTLLTMWLASGTAWASTLNLVFEARTSVTMTYAAAPLGIVNASDRSGLGRQFEPLNYSDDELVPDPFLGDFVGDVGSLTVQVFSAPTSAPGFNTYRVFCTTTLNFNPCFSDSLTLATQPPTITDRFVEIGAAAGGSGFFRLFINPDGLGFSALSPSPGFFISLGQDEGKMEYVDDKIFESLIDGFFVTGVGKSSRYAMSDVEVIMSFPSPIPLPTGLTLMLAAFGTLGVLGLSRARPMN